MLPSVHLRIRIGNMHLRCSGNMAISILYSIFLPRRKDKDKIKFTAREHLNGMQPYNIILCYNVNICILLEDIITILSFLVFGWRMEILVFRMNLRLSGNCKALLHIYIMHTCARMCVYCIL